MTTVKEVMLKIKTDFDRAGGKGQDVGSVLRNPGNLSKGLESIGRTEPSLRKVNTQLEKMLGLLTSIDKLSGRVGRSLSVAGGGAGGGGGNYSGGGGIGGGVSLRGLGLGLSVAYLGHQITHNVISGLVAARGVSLHGGSYAKGSFPLVEHLYDAYTGRDQREVMEQQRDTLMGISMQRRQGVFSASMGLMTGQDELARHRQSPFATPLEQRGLLERQNVGYYQMIGDWRASYGRTQGQLTNERLRYSGFQANRAFAERAQCRFQEIPGENALMRGVRYVNERTGFERDAASLRTGSQEASHGPLEKQIKLIQYLSNNLKEQLSIENQIKANREAQLVIAKQLVVTRQAGAAEYGGLNPFQRAAHNEALQRAVNRQSMSVEQQNLLGQTDIGRQVLQRNAIERSVLGTDREQALRIAGTAESTSEANAINRARALTIGTQAQGFNFDVGKINVAVNMVLANEIVDQMAEGLKNIARITTELAERQAQEQWLRLQQTVNRAAAGGFGAALAAIP